LGILFVSSSRKLAIQKAREYLAVRPVFLDTETTGLDPNAEIIEISVVDHDGSVLFDSLVKPVRPIPLDAVRIHGITDEMVEDARLWPEVWPAVETVLHGRYIGIYNADFDLKMMRQSHRRHGMVWEFPQSRVFDVMKLYADYTGNPRWVTLETAGRQCGITMSNSHRALADTFLLREVFQYIASRTP
jgi:DNA polymerase-3 subunit epsilon